MHYDFRGLLTTDFQDTIQKCSQDKKKLKDSDGFSSTKTGSALNIMKITNGVVTLR